MSLKSSRLLAANLFIWMFFSSLSTQFRCIRMFFLILYTNIVIIINIQIIKRAFYILYTFGAYMCVYFSGFAATVS